MSAGYELAQVNIARLLAPLHTPKLRGFLAGLEKVNAAAEASDGFVWRLVSEDGTDATDFRFFGDGWLIVNMSVWTSPEALNSYVYGEVHRAYLQRRREWFEHLTDAYAAMWWVPEGERPTIADAEERLTHLRENGPSPKAFTMKEQFPKPEA
ncbi:DUF3291 domain-containing protein [Glycomyces sp. NPDC048151]|uniref:DUF3291 domain-containing protein n=1 Tax=Glycomyces sp. NPDC048151 TaxID=3364002 RepID=UPI0037100B4E